jgi:hypothetical protein
MTQPSDKAMQDKTQINKRVQARYDFLMEQGKHGHYETMFKCVHEELALLDAHTQAAAQGAQTGAAVYYHLGTTAIKLPNQKVRDMLEQAVQRHTQAAVSEATEPLASYTDTEGTANPYWLIIDPHQMLKPDCHSVATMITGPFFSREVAQQHLDARRYAFGKHAAVYCHSAYWSKQYCAMQDAAHRAKMEKN